MTGRRAALSVVILVAATACSGERPAPSPISEGSRAQVVIMELTSEAFTDGATVPDRYTCDGQNVSPPLAWKGVPKEAVELALLMDDPDAPGGSFAHWVVYGIPTGDATVPEGQAPAGGTEGANDAGGTGYTGPCPPAGQTHRYVLSLYALARPIGLGPGATLEEVSSAMGEPVAGGQLIVRFGH